MKHEPFALGIDLGGSSIKAVAVTREGVLLGERNVSFDAKEEFDWARQIQQLVRELSDAARQTSFSPQRAADGVSGNNQFLSGSTVRGDSFQRPSNARAATHLSSQRMSPTNFSGVTTPHPDPLPGGGRGRTGARAIGVSAPGLAAADGRSITRMPGRLQGLEGLDWTEFLEVGRAVPSAPQEREDHHTSEVDSRNSGAVRTPRPTQASQFVPVLNDAHAALLGESWLGAARGFQNVFMLTLGTGVGGAGMVDGKLLRGRLGRAGHLGHICLDMDGARDVCAMPGSLEALIGNYNIEERTRDRFKTTHELVEAHLRGDNEATDAWLKSVRALGYGIASLINVLDPEAVVIGGGIARSGAALFEPLEKFVRDAEWDVGAPPVKILPAQLGEFAGAYGAAWNAFQSVSAQTAQK
jgi:glucokinase